MYPLGYIGGLQVILTVVSLILGTDSVTFISDIRIGIVVNCTPDEPIKIKITLKTNDAIPYCLVVFFL